MAYERFENARDNFAKFVYQLKLKTKTLVRKLERILINVSLSFNQTYLKYIYIYIYISKVGDQCQGLPEGSLFDSYCTKM